MKVNITFNLERELLVEKTKKVVHKVCRLITPILESCQTGLLLFFAVAFFLIMPITFFLTEEIVTKSFMAIITGAIVYFAIEIFLYIAKALKKW